MRLDVSLLAKSGWAIMSATMVGTPVHPVGRSRSISSKARPASHFAIRMHLPPPFSAVKKRWYSPVTWNKGTATIAPGCGMAIPGLNSPLAVATFKPIAPLRLEMRSWVVIPRWVWITPLGLPVVPEVYMMLASSSVAISGMGGGAAVAPAAITSAYGVTRPDATCWAFFTSASETRTATSWTFNFLAGPTLWARRSLSTNRTLVPLSDRPYSISPSFHHEFIGTSTAPMRWPARKATHHSGKFLIQIATRSPFFTP
mmetsp:Transcript_46657/g.100024  ORF Transcript_46657/g.100024 Transcript_46657/m.100024 type:complete len:257 (-) Transcript_46657:307-1077(-)